MKTVPEFEVGDILFVVETDNTIIGQYMDDSTMMVEDMIRLTVISAKRDVNTTILWVSIYDIRTCLGNDLEKAKAEYAEYFI